MTSIIFVGEAWGADEAKLKKAFVGASGQELFRMLQQVGFHNEILPYHFVSPYRMARLWEATDIQLLNVFNCRPPDPEGKNRVEYFYGRLSGKAELDRSFPARRFGSANGFLLAKYGDHIHKLHDALADRKPNLIVALGATALWALKLPSSIGKLRGSVIQSDWGKVLPVYHPAAIIRNWSLRVVTLLDFHKARREAAFPEIRVTPRFIWTEPTIEDLYRWWEEHGKHAPLLAVDIETLRQAQISEVGFAASPTQALHIPFVTEEYTPVGKRYRSYWPDTATEKRAWDFVRMVCESATPKIGQNLVQYDVYWLLVALGIRILNITEDTMTKAHCWQPELDKNLGFLGSVFLDERSWKNIRRDVAKGKE